MCFVISNESARTITVAFPVATRETVKSEVGAELVVHPDLHREIYHLQAVLRCREGKLFAECGSCGYEMPLRIDWGTNERQATVKDTERWRSSKAD